MREILLLLMMMELVQQGHGGRGGRCRVTGQVTGMVLRRRRGRLQLLRGHAVSVQMVRMVVRMMVVRVQSDESDRRGARGSRPQGSRSQGSRSQGGRS